MSDTYYVVGIHGAPTPETAPHGVMWRYARRYSTWKMCDASTVSAWANDVQWYPLPPPPTEQAPPPEPVALWQVDFRDGRYCVTGPQGYEVTHDEVMDAADALNALDRDGVAWGPGRPMEELPDTHPEVVIRSELGTYITSNTCRLGDDGAKRRCWWPLPGEAQ